MAAPQGPFCNIRLLILHRYAPGIKKGGAQPCSIENFGRRGKPVKRLRLIPAEKAFVLALNQITPAWPGALGVEQRSETLT